MFCLGSNLASISRESIHFSKYESVSFANDAHISRETVYLSKYESVLSVRSLPVICGCPLSAHFLQFLKKRPFFTFFYDFSPSE
jgi:hypothetical protein